MAIVHLEALGREISALKTKCANNSMAAARAEETATMARDKANEAKQVASRTWVHLSTSTFLTPKEAALFATPCAVFPWADSRWAVDR